jgi:hypothetical protein
LQRRHRSFLLESRKFRRRLVGEDYANGGGLEFGINA